MTTNKKLAVTGVVAAITTATVLLVSTPEPRQLIKVGDTNLVTGLKWDQDFANGWVIEATTNMPPRWFVVTSVTMQVSNAHIQHYFPTINKQEQFRFYRVGAF